jgi:hypothetical protein
MKMGQKWIEFVQKFAEDANSFDLDILFETEESLKAYAVNMLIVLNSCGLEIIDTNPVIKKK